MSTRRRWRCSEGTSCCVMPRSRSYALVALALSVACGSTSPPSGGAGGAGNASGGSVSGAGPTTASGAPGAGGGATNGGASGSGGTPGSAGRAGSGGAPSAGGQNSSGGRGASAGTLSGGGAGSGAAGTSAGGGLSGASTGGRAPSGGASGTGGPAGAGNGGASGACTRDTLQAAAKSLADALNAKDPMKMALDTGATYVENAEASDFTGGIWQSALTIAFQRDFLDVDGCETFSEIVVTDGTPYVLGVRLTLAGDKIKAVTALVSDQDDWQFDAANYMKVSKAEDWSVIPAGERDTRETLIAAGNAYFDLFNDKSVVVPWNTPCTRLEGGKLTTGNTCDVGVPDGITFADKHWVVDRDLGTAIGMVRFGGANGLPDSHMFRSLKGKIRYVHTITICDGGC
jgi:hypothetical protein